MVFNKKKHDPTESELQILQILWQKGPSSVRQVNEILNQEREVGYTTTLKIMQIMTDKGLVTRDTESRTHIYHSAVKEKETQSSLLKNFIAKTYRGSAMSLIIQALGSEEASAEEIEELKKAIDQLKIKGH